MLRAKQVIKIAACHQKHNLLLACEHTGEMEPNHRAARGFGSTAHIPEGHRNVLYPSLLLSPAHRITASNQSTNYDVKLIEMWANQSSGAGRRGRVWIGVQIIL